jgi:hypothetical protein
MKKRTTQAIVTGLSVLAVALSPLAMPGTAKAGSQSSKNVSIRMQDVNVLRSDCRTYPVDWAVKNLEQTWGAGAVVDWRLQLLLKNPSKPDERAARIQLSGTGPKAGRSWFRLCGTKHSAGRFIATATVATTPRATSGCLPLDNDVVFPELPADQTRACSTAVGVLRDRAQISTLFKRPTKVFLEASSNCGRLDDVGVSGIVYRQSDRGTWSRVGRGVAVNIRVVGDPSFPPPTVSPRFIGRAFTDQRGEYRRTGLVSPAPFVNVQATVASTGRHVSGSSRLVPLAISCA